MFHRVSTQVANTHVVSTHVWEIWWAGGGAPNEGDLMPDVAVSTLSAQGGPVSHVTPDGTQHVFCTTSLGYLMELAWRGSETPRLRDLTTLTPDIPALRVETQPSTYVVAAGGSQHVVYASGRSASGRRAARPDRGPPGTPNHGRCAARARRSA